jgi:hypothetical protein
MNGPQSPAPSQVDPTDQANAGYWAAHFGVTVEQIEEAVAAAGPQPDKVREHLLNQGGSAGAG